MLIVLLIISVVCVVLDQLTKALIFGHDGSFIPGFIGFSSARNKGVAWGFMNSVEGALIVITVITVLVIAIMIWGAVRYRKALSYAVGVPLALIVGGAVGNLIDRVFLGYVRDFIATEFMSFPVFNVADSFVTCGGIALVAVVLFTKSGRAFLAAVFPEDSKKKKPEGEEWTDVADDKPEGAGEPAAENEPAEAEKND